MNAFHRLAILGCIVVSLAAQSISPIDRRLEGVWKLSSERIDKGSIPSLPVGSLMTAQRVSDHFIVGITEGGKVITSAISGGGPVKLEYGFSPDAKTLTQTVHGTDSHTGKSYVVTRVWQRQSAASTR